MFQSYLQLLRDLFEKVFDHAGGVVTFLDYLQAVGMGILLLLIIVVIIAGIIGLFFFPYKGYGFFVKNINQKLSDAVENGSHEEITLLEMPDHVHLLIDCNPRFGIMECVKALKRQSSHILRKEFPELNSKLPTLWTRGCFVSTVGSVSLEAVKRYIENQKGV